MKNKARLLTLVVLFSFIGVIEASDHAARKARATLPARAAGAGCPVAGDAMRGGGAGTVYDGKKKDQLSNGDFSDKMAFSILGSAKDVAQLTVKKMSFFCDSKYRISTLIGQLQCQNSQILALNNKLRKNQLISKAQSEKIQRLEAESKGLQSFVKSCQIRIKDLNGSNQSYQTQLAYLNKQNQDLQGRYSSLEKRYADLENSAAKKFWTGVVVGGVAVAAVGAGALVYVAQKKPELLSKLQR